MTPTEQDKELRESILVEFKNVHRLAPADYTENCTNIVMQLIIADRKRVALEARLDMAQRVTTHFVKSGVFELGFNHKGFIIGKDNLIKELQAELEKK